MFLFFNCVFYFLLFIYVFKNLLPTAVEIKPIEVDVNKLLFILFAGFEIIFFSTMGVVGKYKKLLICPNVLVHKL